MQTKDICRQTSIDIGYVCGEKTGGNRDERQNNLIEIDLKSSWGMDLPFRRSHRISAKVSISNIDIAKRSRIK